LAHLEKFLIFPFGSKPKKALTPSLIELETSKFWNLIF
jgi:hypothetical protein